MDDFRSRLSEEFEEAVQTAQERMRESLEAQADAIVEQLGHIQSLKGRERLFKAFPDFGAEAERTFAWVKKEMAKMQADCKTAQEMARAQSWLKD